MTLDVGVMEIVGALAMAFVFGACMGFLSSLIITSRDKKVRVLQPDQVIISRQDLFDLVLHVPQAMKMRMLKAAGTPPELKTAIEKEFTGN